MTDQSYKKLQTKGNDTTYFNAYHYGFDATGVAEIDYILRAIAYAGRHSHHTECWGDEDDWYGKPHVSPVQHIQNAANDAAKAMRKLKGDVDD